MIRAMGITRRRLDCRPGLACNRIGQSKLLRTIRAMGIIRRGLDSRPDPARNQTGQSKSRVRKRQPSRYHYGEYPLLLLQTLSVRSSSRHSLRSASMSKRKRNQLPTHHRLFPCHHVQIFRRSRRPNPNSVPTTSFPRQPRLPRRSA